VISVSSGATLLALELTSSVGKTLAYTTVLFHDEYDQLVARGSHTKFVYSVSLLWLFTNCGFV